jgi:hypothetical protein
MPVRFVALALLKWKCSNAFKFLAHYLISGTIFGKGLLKTKYVLASVKTSSQTFLILKII